MTTTEKKKESPTLVLTPEFRVSFSSVFQARKMEESAEPKFGLTMLFPKTTDLKEMKAAVKAAIIEEWGPDSSKWPTKVITDDQGKPKTVSALRLPFRDGTEKEYEGYGPDVIFCSASSKNKPRVVDQDIKDIIDVNEFYSGCYARAKLNAYAYDVKGNKGVAFGLRNVQKMRDGERFSGGSRPEDDFSAVPRPAGAAPASDTGIEGL